MSHGLAQILRVLFDRLAAAAGLVLLSPLLAAAAFAIVLDDSGPVFFRQTRIGRGGRRFELWKFRSMRQDVPGTRITAGEDPRVTRVGKVLRRYKIDELPQLWNVVRGDMSLVGPRPEVPAFVDASDPAWRQVLEARPGITDFASLMYRHEEELLAQSGNPEAYYRQVILPAKLAMNAQHLRRRSFWLDLRLIALTVQYSLLPAGFDPDRVRRIFVSRESA